MSNNQVKLTAPMRSSERRSLPECSTHRGVDRGTKCIGSPDSAVRRRKPGMSPGPSLLRQCERHDSKRATSLDPRPGALSVSRLGSNRPQKPKA